MDENGNNTIGSARLLGILLGLFTLKREVVIIPYRSL